MSYQPVYFVTPHNAYGFALSDLLANSVTVIRNTDDPVMIGVKGSSLKMIIEWPGYFADTVTIPLTEALTRGKLALLVCRAFASYFQKAAGMACDRRCAHMRIGVGANGIKNVTVQSVEFSSSMKAWYPKFNIS